MNPQQIVTDALNAVSFGPEVSYENLTVVPLLAREEREADYLTLDEALAHGWVQIEEVNEAGNVPELRVINRARKGILLVDGEELIGAKQNRIINLTILVPAGKTMVIPVSCVEAGRWRQVSRRFAAAPRVQFAEGRAAKMRDVTASLASRGRRSSDQTAVWHHIARKAARLNVQSDTSAMAAMFDAAGKSIEDYVSAISSIDRQCGAVFLVNGRVAGLELFDSPSIWRKVSPKVVRSFALDAIDRRKESRSKSVSDEGSAFVASVASTTASVFPAVGVGEDVRLSDLFIAGGALVADGRLVHVSAFPVPVEGGELV